MQLFVKISLRFTKNKHILGLPQTFKHEKIQFFKLTKSKKSMQLFVKIGLWNFFLHEYT